MCSLVPTLYLSSLFPLLVNLYLPYPAFRAISAIRALQGLAHLQSLLDDKQISFKHSPELDAALALYPHPVTRTTQLSLDFVKSLESRLQVPELARSYHRFYKESEWLKLKKL